MENDIQPLSGLYKNLRDAYIRGEKKSLLPSKSLYLALLDLHSANKRMRIFLSAAVPFNALEISTGEELLKLGYIQYVGQERKVALTSKGLWEVEVNTRLIDQESLLQFIERKEFDFFKKVYRPLDSKEKIILFLVLAVRAFSEKSAFDLKHNKNILDATRLIIEKVIDFLIENELILEETKIKEEMFKGKREKKETSLHPILHFFRYSADMPPKTTGLYKAPGGLIYYLDIYKNQEVREEDLVFLFGLIFEGNKKYDLIEKVYNFCCDISYDANAQIFSSGGHIFANPQFDDLINKSLRSLILGT